ncbi:MAG: NAD(P)H-dependent oxidoreductase [Cellulosilyticum sp.]|nr:NAD(P)H-dependent oxidoreductase [Cellulosilyticum sp.]
MPQKIVWLNGSPKSDTESFSYKMIQYFTKALKGHYDTFVEGNAFKLCQKNTLLEAHFREVLMADSLVIVSPLYADNMPSSVLDYLRSFECFIKSHPELITHPIKVYGFINCGFLGGQQNHIALEILEHFANRMHFIWGGGLGIGSGPMLAATLESVPRESKMQQPIFAGLDSFIDALQSGTLIDTSHRQLLVTQNYLPSLFIISMNIAWTGMVGQNFHKLYNKPYKKS